MDKELQRILQYLPIDISSAISNEQTADITEIRLRQNSFVTITINNRIKQLNVLIRQNTLQDILLKLCQYSLPAFEDQLSNGYVTIDGGHRIGVAGDYSQSPTGEWVLKNVTSLNIRISKDIYFNLPNEVFLFKKGLLVVGPPHTGKTTALRTIAKKIMHSKNVAICDERKEITSTLSGCDNIVGMNKAKAIQIATRTLNPQVIICDEIGDYNESVQILSAVNTGVQFVCSAHSNSYDELKSRPNIKLLLDACIFDKVIFLHSENNNFYVKEINDV